MFPKEEGLPADDAALAPRISKAVTEVVKKVESGVDLVNDGEMSKPSYATYVKDRATYVKDRLTGFAGSSNSFVYKDFAEFDASLCTSRSTFRSGSPVAKIAQPRR